MVYIIFISVAVPLFMLLFMMEGQPRRIVGFVILGIASAVMSYEINSLIKHIYNISDSNFRVLVSPITEELIKFIPPLFFTLLISDKRKNIIITSMAVGIGFAVMENIYLLVLEYEYVNIFWALIRGFATGLMHGITTATVGYGLTFIHKKKLFYTGIFGLACVSITYHGIYNLLVGSRYNHFGFMMPLMTYLILCVITHKNIYDY